MSCLRSTWSRTARAAAATTSAHSTPRYQNPLTHLPAKRGELLIAPGLPDLT